LDEFPSIDVKAVVTYPEEHDGWWEGSLYKLATDLGYPIVNEEELLEFDLDYILSTLYYNILDEELLTHPTHGGLNLHQAELPRYRGSNSFSHAILNARDDDYWQYGTTLHYMSEEVDAGDIIKRNFVEIDENDTAHSLYQKTEDESVELLFEMLPKIVSGEIEDMRTQQDEFEGPSYFYSNESLDGEKLIPYETLTDQNQATEVYDKIRALDFPPFKPAYTEIDGEEIYLVKDYERGETA
jgi:methionyl-tRNA formyltransferase